MLSGMKLGVMPPASRPFEPVRQMQERGPMGMPAGDVTIVKASRPD
jgi:hypothetical protein